MRHLIGGCLWLLITATVCHAASDAPLPFAPGEKLVFHLRWGLISAGKATLEVLPTQDMDGTAATHFVLTAETNSFVDLFYKVRDRIDSYTDEAVTRSLHYTKHQREGSHRKKIQVTFDWHRNTAQYANYGKAKAPVTILPGTFDPLGILYFARRFDHGRHQLLERPVTDGKKCVIGRATVVRRETIQVPAGVYDTFLLKPDLRDVGGVFEKDREAHIHLWVTADQRRMPVKVKSKVIVGSFVGELVTAHLPPPAPPENAPALSR